MKESEKERKERNREKTGQPTERQQALVFRGLFPLGLTGRRESMIGEVRGTNSHVYVWVRACVCSGAQRGRINMIG